MFNLTKSSSSFYFQPSSISLHVFFLLLICIMYLIQTRHARNVIFITPFFLQIPPIFSKNRFIIFCVLGSDQLSPPTRVSVTASTPVGKLQGSGAQYLSFAVYSKEMPSDNKYIDICLHIYIYIYTCAYMDSYMYE